MPRSLSTLLTLLALTAVLVGCSQEPNPVAPGDTSSSMNNAVQAAPAAVPADAVVDSAFIYLYASSTDTQTVTVHTVTSDWAETVTTFTDFGGAFDAAPLGSLELTDPGWYAVEVTAQAQGWFDSTLTNFGFFVQPADSDTGQTVFTSREGDDNQPYLQVFYTTFDGSSVETLDALADTYLYSADPEVNFGTETSLLVDRQPGTDSVFQSLVRFEFPVEVRYATVGDWVWNDEDMNGLQDEGETGLEGIVVNLYACEGDMIASTVTDADGYYLFEMLEAGDYHLEFVRPNGYVYTYADEGDDDALDSDADSYTGLTACFSLNPGDEVSSLDAGLYAFDGCTYGKGYWKNHAGLGPQEDLLSSLLPLWLGDDDGDMSLAVDNAEMAVALLQQHEYGHPSNGITKLYAHLLATKLNVASWANSEDVDDAIADADTFLADHDWTDWDSLDHDTRVMILDWKDTFEQFNEGEIGPGTCDDSDDDDADDMD